MHFVNPLPFLLDYSIYIPLLFRIVISYFLFTTFFILGKIKKQDQTEIANTHTFSFLENSLVISIIRFCIPFIILLSLIGAFTQIAAALSIVIFLCMSLLPEAKITPVGNTGFTLLVFISLCLLISGAGHYALDYPL